MNLENEVLIYDLKNNKAYCLNKIASMVWVGSNGNNSIVEIINLLSYKVGSLVSQALILLALDRLKRNDLLENEEDFLFEFSHF